MSRIAYTKELTLSSTSPYVDALLCVTFQDGSSAPPAGHSPRKSLTSQFRVHRLILSRMSNYFYNEFKRLEADEKAIDTTQNDTSESPAFWKLNLAFRGKSERELYNLFPSVLDFLYGKPLAQLDLSKAFEYLGLASRFEVPRLTSVISESLVAGITKETAFPLLLKSVQFDAVSIQERCLEILARNFQTMFPSIKAQLNDLPLRTFSTLMNHPSLSITSEYRVYKIVRSYYRHHVDENGVTRLEKSERKSLFSAVRLAHLKYNELEKVIRDQIVPKSLLTEALTHRITLFEKPANLPPEESLALRLRKRVIGRLFEPPSPPLDCDPTVPSATVAPSSLSSSSSSTSSSSHATIPLTSSTSATHTAPPLTPHEPPRGLIYFLATNGGKSEWKNPSLTGSIKVSCSSIEKGKAHNLVDLEPQDCWTMDIPASWVAIDIRQGRLIPSHYTLRHGGGSKMDLLRNWVIQACDNDGDRWVEISRHTNDPSLQGAFGIHTWKISVDLQRPFRQFRILQTGHNSGSTNFLSLSYIELYGLYFPKTQA